MKISTINGVLSAQAETVEDIKLLLSVSQKQGEISKGELLKMADSQVKRKLRSLNCDICGRKCLTVRGMAIHKSSLHGIKSQHNKYYLSRRKRIAQATSAVASGWGQVIAK